MLGGEIFVPKLPSYNIVQLVKCIEPDASIQIIGIRPGEKLHESMISTTESFNTIICNSFYVILPQIEINKKYKEKYGTLFMKSESEYSSGDNVLIEKNELKQMIYEIV